MTRGMITWFQRTRYRLFSLSVLSICCQLTSVKRLHNVHVSHTDFTPLFRTSFNNTRRRIVVFLEGGQWRPINRSPIQRPIGQLMSTTLRHVRLSRLSQAVPSTLTHTHRPVLPFTSHIHCFMSSCQPSHLHLLCTHSSHRGVTQPVIMPVEGGQAGRKETSFGTFTWSKYIDILILGWKPRRELSALTYTSHQQWLPSWTSAEFILTEPGNNKH